MSDTNHDWASRRILELEAQLATANGLLEKASRALTSPCDRLIADIKNHLTARGMKP